MLHYSYILFLARIQLNRSADMPPHALPVPTCPVKSMNKVGMDQPSKKPYI